LQSFANSEKASNQILQQFQHLKESLANLSSYRVEGTGTVTETEAFLKLITPEKSQKFKNFKFTAWAQDKAMKVKFTLVDTEGNTVETQTYYIDPKNNQQVYQVEKLEHIATISPIAPSGIPYVNPAFTQYSFLSDISDFGVPSLSPASLREPTSWNPILQSSQKFGVEGNEYSLKLPHKRSTAEIFFQFSENFIQPRAINIYNEKSELITEKAFSNYVPIENFGFIPKTIQNKYYQALNPGSTPAHVTTWNFSITRFEVNTPIASEEFQFDPSSVERIWDATEQIWIDVPK